jgi:hypothetical protein
MTIPARARANFETLLRAAADSNLALMECMDAVTSEPRYVICAVGRDGTDFVFTPFGCRVLNKHHAGVPSGAVYIGRGSKWGNPFRIGPDGDRAAVIAKYERWLADQHHLLRARRAARPRSRLLLRAARLSRRSAAAACECGADARIAWWRAVKAAA